MRYRTIVVDPPWDYGVWRSTTSAAYPQMSLNEIQDLPVREMAEPDAHVYLWSVLPLMADAFDVVRGWGFKPSTVLTWCKPGPGLGGGFRGNTEHLIVARGGEPGPNPSCSECRGQLRGAKRCTCGAREWTYRGRPFIPTMPFRSVADGSWFAAPRGEHSAKPDLFLDLVERMSPGPYLEMFARRNRLGWDTWGNEALEHVDIGGVA